MKSSSAAATVFALLTPALGCITPFVIVTSLGEPFTLQVQAPDTPAIDGASVTFIQESSTLYNAVLSPSGEDFNLTLSDGVLSISPDPSGVSGGAAEGAFLVPPIDKPKYEKLKFSSQPPDGATKPTFEGRYGCSPNDTAQFELVPQSNQAPGPFCVLKDDTTGDFGLWLGSADTNCVAVTLLPMSGGKSAQSPVVVS